MTHKGVRCSVWIVALCASLTATVSAATAADRVADAKRLVQLEAKGDFAAVESNVDLNSRKIYSEERLKRGWAGFTKRAGKLKSIGAGKQQKLAMYDLVTLSCMFEKGAADAKVAFNAAGKVMTIYFSPSPGSKLPPEPRGGGGPPRGFGGRGGPGGGPGARGRPGSAD